MASKGGRKVSQKEKKKENEILVSVYVETRDQILILIKDSRICLWGWDGIFIDNKC